MALQMSPRSSDLACRERQLLGSNPSVGTPRPRRVSMRRLFLKALVRVLVGGYRPRRWQRWLKAFFSRSD
jgi:hypothetical protein